MTDRLRLSALEQETMTELIKIDPLKVSPGYLCRAGGINIDKVYAYLRRQVKQGYMKKMRSCERDGLGRKLDIYRVINPGVAA